MSLIPISGPNQFEGNLQKLEASAIVKCVEDDENICDNMLMDPIPKPNELDANLQPASAKVKCLECGNYFAYRRNLKRHFLKVHPRKPFPQEQKVLKYNCSFDCGKSFAHRRNLKRHFQEVHPGKPFPQEQKVFKYNCDECPRKFNYIHLLKAHQRTIHGHTNNFVPKSHKCFLCFMEFEKKLLLSHYESEHAIKVEEDDLSFSSMYEFLLWKENLEKNTKCKYVVNCGAKKFAEKTHHYYRCHRSGYFESSSRGLRVIKSQGSKKINYFCPSSMKAIESADGQCKVKFIKSHVGHQNELGHLQLTLSEKKSLAEKLAMKIPLDAILDGIRDSLSELERIHLLTKQDLYNIEKSFNLNSAIKKHSNDGVSVDIWVSEVKESSDDCILFYKPQGVSVSDEPVFKKDDFALIIMNEAQKEMLKKYGNDCICVDGTHGLNAYDFELFTLMVIDDIREGFPCAFFISSRADEEAFSTFFNYVKASVGNISANVFMSDMALSFYNAWIRVMDHPKHFLYCTWHVDRAWRKNLNKIKGRENQVIAYKILRTILEERDETAVKSMLTSAIEQLYNNVDTASYAEYFQEHYVNNIERWAFCYRQHCGLNTNMHLERMHRTIKYIYLSGKAVKRLDKSLHALMRFLRDKMVEKIIAIEKGKISSKIKNIRNRHRNSCNFQTVITKSEQGWDVLSEEKDEIYCVEERNTKCPKCKLICKQCNVCIHKYVCSCHDSAIKWNMCKHIHKVCMFLKEENDFSIDGNCEALNVCDDDNETDFLTQQLKKSHTLTHCLEEETDKIKMEYVEMCTGLNKRQLDFLKKNLLYIKATLPTLEENATSSNSFTPVRNVSQNENIDPQRRLYSTKKVRKSMKLNILPTSQEKKNIAISLILKNKNSGNSVCADFVH